MDTVIYGTIGILIGVLALLCGMLPYLLAFNPQTHLKGES